MLKVKSNIKIVQLERFSSILMGEKDFKNFQNTGSNMKSTKRKIYNFAINKKQKKNIYNDSIFNYYELLIEANPDLQGRITPLLKEARELMKILGSIYEKAK